MYTIQPKSVRHQVTCVQLGVKGTKKSRVHARPLRELPRFENSRDVEMPAGFVQPEG